MSEQIHPLTENHQMITKTLLSSMLLAGLVAMSAAKAQDSELSAITNVEAAVMGEGEVRISEALANALVESSDAADFDAAMDNILALRDAGMGWSEIAQELGVDNLGLVVADAMSQGRSSVGLAIANENRNRGEIGIEVAGADASAGAETAASARAQAEVGRAIAADARVNARINGSLRGSTSGRPAGVGAPILPQQVIRPAAPVRPAILQRPLLGGGRGG